MKVRDHRAVHKLMYSSLRTLYWRLDGILLQFGGKTALNCSIQLKGSGIPKPCKVAEVHVKMAASEIVLDVE